MKGEKGDKGYIGETGFDGETGDIGLSGEKGEIGKAIFCSLDDFSRYEDNWLTKQSAIQSDNVP